MNRAVSWKNTLSYREGADATPPTQRKSETRIGVFFFKLGSLAGLMIPTLLFLRIWLEIMPVRIGFWDTVWVFFQIYSSIFGLSVVAIYSWRFGQWLQIEISRFWDRYTGEVPPEVGLPIPTNLRDYLLGEISPYRETRQGPSRNVIIIQLLGGLTVMALAFIATYLLIQISGFNSPQESLSISNQAQTFFVVALSAVGGAILAAVVLIIFIVATSSADLMVLLVIVIPPLLFISIAVNNLINTFERWFYDVLTEYQLPF